MRTIQAPQRLVSCGREWRKRRLRGPIGFYPPAPKPKSSLSLIHILTLPTN
jgi:hypothetical protein